jgi:hypothetical protein
MRRRAIARSALLLVWFVMSFAMPTAHAETNTLAKAGSWAAFGGTTVSGVPVCGISRDVGGKYFGLKQYSNSDTFTIQVGAKDWKIADKLKINVIMRFDTSSPWNGVGTGMHFNDGDPGLEFDVKRNQIDRFAAEFHNSGQMQIQFQNRDMMDWVLDLAGTKSVSDAFQRCIRNLK